MENSIEKDLNFSNIKVNSDTSTKTKRRSSLFRSTVQEDIQNSFQVECELSVEYIEKLIEESTQWNGKFIELKSRVLQLQELKVSPNKIEIDISEYESFIEQAVDFHSVVNMVSVLYQEMTKFYNKRKQLLNTTFAATTGNFTNK